MATVYKVFPPIGFARVGGSSSGFLVARERLGHGEKVIDAHGNETDATDYKGSDSGILPIAARFRVFAFHDDGAPPTPVDGASGAKIQWTVNVANRKNSVNRAGSPPSSSALPVDNPANSAAKIAPGPHTIAGSNTGPVGLTGGVFHGVQVSLGELRTDKNQNLLVVGARGKAQSSTGASIGGFYANPSWYDDACDGVVQAIVTLPDGTRISDVSSAWVVSGPPDYAPGIEGLVTLYDVMREVGRVSFGMTMGQISFTKDIYPIIRRAHELRWVNTGFNWASISTNWPALSNNTASTAGLRQSTVAQIKLGASRLQQFQLTQIQLDILQAYSGGSFANDWTGVPQSSVVTADELTRVALDSTVGQGFFPGIEAGIVTKNSSIYSVPFEFRLNAGVVKPGDLTALMAVPWQADFFACGSDWWPSQRPNDVLTTVGGVTDDWSRGVFSGDELVSNFNRLGFIKRKVNGGNVLFVEEERDPGL